MACLASTPQTPGSTDLWLHSPDHKHQGRATARYLSQTPQVCPLLSSGSGQGAQPPRTHGTHLSAVLLLTAQPGPCSRSLVPAPSSVMSTGRMMGGQSL